VLYSQEGICGKRLATVKSESEVLMLRIFQGEQRNGRVKFTTDRDCLAPDIIRLTERVFPNMEELKTAAAKWEDRGFRVCIDTEECFYETERP
jgi:hypothetical protein